MFRRPLACTWAASGLLLASAPLAARAEPPAMPRARLDYRVPPILAPACPDEAAFRKRVALRIGYDPFVPATDTRAQQVRVEVTAPPEPLAIDVTLANSEGLALGQKHLTEGTCDELVSSAAFAASLAIDPSAAMRAPWPDVSPPAPTAEPSAPVGAGAPAPPAPAARDAPASPPPPVEAGVVAAAGIAVGAAPAATPVAVLGVDVRRAALSAGLEGRFDLAASDVIQDVEVRTSLLAAGVSLCGHFDIAGPVSSSACAVGYVGALRGESLGIEQPRIDRTVYSAVAPRLAMHVRLGGTFGLVLRAEVPFVLTETELSVDDRVVWTTPLAALVTTAGAMARF
jgi:hypothetical protein